MERVSVFIDGENLVYGIKSVNPFYTDFKFDFEKRPVKDMYIVVTTKFINKYIIMYINKTVKIWKKLN